MNTELLKSKLLEAAFNGSLTHADTSTWANATLGMVAEYRKGPFGSSLTKAMFVPFSNNTIKVYEQQNAIKKNYSLGHYYITKDKYESMKGFTVSPQDIIVSCAGTIGETYILPNEAPTGIINQALMRVKTNELITREYWCLLFRHIITHDVEMRGAGVAIANIPPFSYLKTIPILLPSITEQQRIVAALEEGFAYIDAVASAKQNLSDTAELLRNKILQAAFDGTLTGADTNTWDWTPMKHVTKIMCDGDWIEKKDQSENGIRLVQTGNVGNGCFIDKPSSYKYISEDTFKRLNCTEIFPGDILFSRLPSPVGRACELPQVNYRMITAVDCTIVRLKEIIDKKFFLYYVQSPTYHYKMAENNFITGTTRARISRSNLEKMPVPLPPLAEQQRIVAKIEELFAEIDKMK